MSTLEDHIDELDTGVEEVATEATEPPPVPRRCEYCIFYQSDDPETANKQCRRHAPVPDRVAGSFAFWPTTRPNQWCGEFRWTGEYEKSEEETEDGDGSKQSDTPQPGSEG